MAVICFLSAARISLQQKLCTGIWQRIADHCLPYSNGKVVTDLGAGDGTLGKLLQAGNTRELGTGAARMAGRCPKPGATVITMYKQTTDFLFFFKGLVSLMETEGRTAGQGCFFLARGASDLSCFSWFGVFPGKKGDRNQAKLFLKDGTHPDGAAVLLHLPPNRTSWITVPSQIQAVL